jgi:hypothetical protein
VQVYLASLNLPRKEVHGGPDKKYGERSTVAIEQEGWIDALSANIKVEKCHRLLFLAVCL